MYRIVELKNSKNKTWYIIQKKFLFLWLKQKEYNFNYEYDFIGTTLTFNTIEEAENQIDEWKPSKIISEKVIKMIL